MRHVDEISHLGKLYTLTHLNQTIREFEWRNADNSISKYNFRITYSTHCYSDKNIEPQDGCYRIADKDGDRVFSELRHEYSFVATQMIDGLFSKPTKSVQLTYEDNWTIYQLQMTPPLAQGERYCVFFRIRPSPKHAAIEGADCLDLFVESAYPRSNMVATLRAIPFGKVAERSAAEHRAKKG